MSIHNLEQTMLAIIFLIFGILFSWLLHQAISTREIMARGWGFSIRSYSRDDEPVWYWVTFISYSICVIVSIAVGILLI